MAKTAVVYMQPGCPACHQAMEYLSRKGVTVERHDIRSDPKALQELLDRGFRVTPVILIGDAAIPGFDPEKIDAALGE